MHAIGHATPAGHGESAAAPVFLRDYRVHPTVSADSCAEFRRMGVRWNASLGAGFVDPMPTEQQLAAFYSTEYRRVMHKATGLEYYLGSPNYRAQARSLVHWANPLLQLQGCWLDIGAGFGLLLSEVRRLVPQWELHAIEPAQEAQSALAQVARVERDFEGFWRGQGGLHGHYDVVSLIHVLEHLRNPWSALQELHDRLRPGGLLLLEVPNDHLAELMRTGRQSDLPHLWFFSGPGLTQIVRAAGFEVLKTAELGLRRPGCRAPFANRVGRTIRRMTRGRLTLADDLDWYAEAPDRCDLRILCRKATAPV